MKALDPRKVRILQAVVHDYVITTRPVGSERLLEIYQLGCKSATIRNEMAEMSEMGYLQQPHTSAGRIPTDTGYRFYVDELMDPPTALRPEEAQVASQETQPESSEIADIMIQTCRLLSRLTSYPSLATDPVTETTQLRHFYLAAAGARHILMILLLSTGHVEHRLIDVEVAPSESVLIKLSNFINSQVADRELLEVTTLLNAQTVPADFAAQSALLIRVNHSLAATTASLAERKIYLEGASQILRQPEFQDVNRLEGLLGVLEQRSLSYQMLSHALLAYGVTVVIGAENSLQAMRECSVITSSYRIGDRPAGYLGVVGPTRMNYDRATAAVNLMARSLSATLTNLSLA